MRTDEARPLRRMKSITTVLSTIALGIAAFVVLVNARDPWWHTLLLAPSLAGAIWVVSRWHTRLEPRLVLPLLGIGQATWIAAVLLGIDPMAVLGLAVVGGVAISTRDKHRLRDSVLLTGVVAVTGLLALLVRPGELADYTVTPAVYVVCMIAVFWLNDLTWRLFTELDAMRRTEAELAVVRERFRFASDLHDIQGHTLHVIKLKAAVAARLQHSDPERTAAELAEIQRLTAETIEQARHLANSTHKLTFEAELTNATALFEAAGIEVRVDNRSQGQVADDIVFALVLREATTNILRHSQAREVAIAVETNRLKVRNDGVAGEGGGLQGLIALRNRVVDAGGALNLERGAGTFELSLRLGRGAA